MITLGTAINDAGQLDDPVIGYNCTLPDHVVAARTFYGANIPDDIDFIFAAFHESELWHLPLNRNGGQYPIGLHDS